MEIILKDKEIKEIVKDILYKMLKEERDFFKEIMEEVIEDIGLTNAIEEGKKGRFVNKSEIFEIIDNELKVQK